MTDPEYMKTLLGYGGFAKLPALRGKLVPLAFKRKEELFVYSANEYLGGDSKDHAKRRDKALSRVRQWLEENQIQRDKVKTECVRQSRKVDYTKWHRWTITVRVLKPVVLYVPALEDEWWDEMEEKAPQRIVLNPEK